MSYIIDRLNEPSTRLAIATILGIVAPMFPAYTVIIQGVAGALAGHMMLTPDPQK